MSTFQSIVLIEIVSVAYLLPRFATGVKLLFGDSRETPGWSAQGEPKWVAACCRAVGTWLPKAQIVVLILGLLLTRYTAYRVARDITNDRRVLRAIVPWAGLAVALFAAGVWIVLQPMQMRGTIAG